MSCTQVGRQNIWEIRAVEGICYHSLVVQECTTTIGLDTAYNSIHLQAKSYIHRQGLDTQQLQDMSSESCVRNYHCRGRN